jgi:WD40 repeat protein/tRNA A-37 threonylcarbamoyl transferase component Bud32
MATCPHCNAIFSDHDKTNRHCPACGESLLPAIDPGKASVTLPFLFSPEGGADGAPEITAQISGGADPADAPAGDVKQSVTLPFIFGESADSETTAQISGGADTPPWEDPPVGELKQSVTLPFALGDSPESEMTAQISGGKSETTEEDAPPAVSPKQSVTLPFIFGEDGTLPPEAELTTQISGGASDAPAKSAPPEAKEDQGSLGATFIFGPDSGVGAGAAEMEMTAQISGGASDEAPQNLPPVGDAKQSLTAPFIHGSEPAELEPTTQISGGASDAPAETPPSASEPKEASVSATFLFGPDTGVDIGNSTVELTTPTHETAGAEPAPQTPPAADAQPKPPGESTPALYDAPPRVGSGTVPDRRIAQTVDFESLERAGEELPSSAKKPETIAFVPSMQTVDFEPGAVGTSHDGGTGASYEIDLAKTFDSKELKNDLMMTANIADVPSDVEVRVSQVWGEKIPTDVSPRMTIKAAEKNFGKPDQSLVIKSRSMADAKERELTGTRAEYEFLEILGEGGMGVVYSARQSSIDRTVALKMLKPHMAKDLDQRQKFLSEAVVTGDLDHPNIVPIYDLGANDAGALFYAMKKVEGTPWMKVIEKKSVHQNIDILLKVADAIAFAHSRGVVHRDLKPENIMLGDFGEVLVMDWGLAYSGASFRKAASIMQTHSMGGTPAYMSPEMAIGPIDRVGPHSDIYLMGAILWEIITGRPPHTGNNVTRCLHAAARNDIQPTEKTGELVDIAMKAMATKPEDRYASTLDLQAAIRGYLAHSESIALSARAEEDLEEAKKSNEYQAYARALFGFEEAVELWDGNARAREYLAKTKLAYASTALDKGDFDLGASLLIAGDPEHEAVASRIEAAKREREARQQRLKNAKRIAVGLVATVFVVVTVALFFINQQRNLAIKAGEEARAAEIVAINEGKAARAAEKVAIDEGKKARAAEKDAIEKGEEARQQRDQATMAKVAADKARIAADEARVAEVYQAYLARIGAAAGKIEENAFESAAVLLDECPEELRHWEWGRLRYLCSRDELSMDAGKSVSSVAYGAKGDRCASGGWDGKVRIWSLPSGAAGHVLDYQGVNVHAVALSPDEKLVAAGGNDKQGYIKLWDVTTGQFVRKLEGHTDSVLSLAFSRKGDRLLSTSYDGTARLWDTVSGSQLCVFTAHSWWVWGAAFSPDEQEVITASQDGTAIVSSVIDAIRRQNSAEKKPPPPPRVFREHKGAVYAVAVSPDGQRVASVGDDKRTLIWNSADVKPLLLKDIDFSGAKPPTRFPLIELRSGDSLPSHAAPVHSVAFSSDGQRLVTGGFDNVLRVWDVASGQLIKTLRGHAGQVRSCCFSPDGKRVLSGDHNGQVKLWNIDDYEEVKKIGERKRTFSGHSDGVLDASFSPDGQQIVTASRDRTAKTWDARNSDKPLKTFEEGHAFLASTVLFFPGGTKLLTAAVDGTTRIWDASAGTQLLRLNDTGRSAAAALSTDGKWIATGSNEKTAKLWNAVDGQLVRTFPVHRTEVTAIALSPDGKWLFTGEASGRCNVWKTASGEPAWSQLQHSRKITAAAFTPDGTRVLTASIDNSVGQWDVAKGQELPKLVLKHKSPVSSLALVGGNHAITVCEEEKPKNAGAEAKPIPKLYRWNIETAQLIEATEFTGGLLSFVAVAPGGQRALAISTNDRVGHLWDLSAKREIFSPNGMNQPFLSVRESGGILWAAAFSPDGKQLVSVGGAEARLWDAATGQLKQTFNRHGAVASARYSPDGKRIVTGSWDNSAKIWNVATALAESKLINKHTGYVNSAVYSSDGRYLLTASDDGTAWLWDAATGEAIRDFRGHTDRVARAVFSPDGKQVLTASGDKTARLWETASGKELRQYTAHTEGLLWAEFSRDGTRIVTTAKDNQAKIWNTETGELVLTLAGHTASVTSATISPDGLRALTASQDRTVKLWDVSPRREAETDKDGKKRAGKEILSLKGHAQEVTSVSFSPDGRYALSASRDGDAIIWPSIEWKPMARETDEPKTPQKQPAPAAPPPAAVSKLEAR